jgi:hypothetical protein
MFFLPLEIELFPLVEAVGNNQASLAALAIAYSTSIEVYLDHTP